MAEKEYIIPYSNDARKRHYHKTSRGKVEKFVVQLEVKYKGRWKEVVRYDCAHGFAHRDSYNLVGRYKKEELRLGFEDALTLALEGDEEFNRWSYEIAKSHAEKGQPVIYVRIKKIRPIRSRIEELELEQQEE